MDLLRTSEERFLDLPGWPFRPRYVEVPDDAGGTIRIHYVDEGPADGLPILMLHGEPSWSYLYRKVIPPTTAAGLRAVAVDLVGFGGSDKPSARSDYTYERHVDWIRAVIYALDLAHITLLGQDWGGLIGLRLAAEEEDRFDAIVAANTFLPTGDMPPSEPFLRWRRYSQESKEFPIGSLVNRACVAELAPEVIAAYDAPFPDDTYKEGARQFPVLVPISTDDPATEANRRAWEVLSKWEKPFLTVFGDSDPITRGADLFFQSAVPGTKGQPHVVLEGAGHYLQEDKGEELGRIVAEFVA